MRILQALIALLFVVAGVLFGALNPQAVTIDFGFWSTQRPVGVVILLALLVGVVLGGLVIGVGVMWPPRRQIRKPSRRPTRAEAPPPDALPPPTS